MALNLFHCNKNTQHTIEHSTYQCCLAGIFKNLLVASGILSVLILLVLWVFLSFQVMIQTSLEGTSADVVNFQ
jgi:hypothetical protein